MENKVLKFGIVGAGFIVKEFLDNAKELPNVEVTGIFSRTYAHAKEISDQYSIAEVYSSFDDLLNSDVDAIYIATQNNTHFLYAQKALMANKHVLCEKPAGVNFTQLYELLNLAEEKKLKFMEAMRFLYVPAFIELKNILETKVFGEIVSCEGSLGRISQRTYRHTKDLCGGALMDLGIYSITAVIDILGSPDSITSSCLKNEDAVDSTISAIFTYNSGQIANIHASFKSLTRSELRICFEKGVITLPKNFTTTNQIILESVEGEVETIELPQIGTGMMQEIEHFRTAPRHMLNNDLSAKVIRTMDKIRAQQEIVFEFDE